MDWNRWYSLKSYLRSSLWTVPLIAVALYAVVKPVAEVVGRWMITQGTLDPKNGLLGLSMTGARSLVGDIVSTDMAFLVFTFGSLLVAIQVAGGQYTPRIIATTSLRDNIIRSISGLFVFTLWRVTPTCFSSLSIVLRRRLPISMAKARWPARSRRM
ncbi:DUF2254 family protein [Paraburkholderia heleia]|uniref:DUF2254 family protein n=1 Tax=Paraburkholderia heleia TaxID=634127 RepID=UPI002AB67F07|nr:DUF2254 family protein [Paraburkholderia heleia]